MEVMGLVVLLAAIIWAAVSYAKSERAEAAQREEERAQQEEALRMRQAQSNKRIFDRFYPTIKRLWKQAENERYWHKENRSFPGWYYDEVTPDQERKLEELYVEITEGELTKGMASDLIGVFYPPEDPEVWEEEGISVPNQTLERYIARELKARNDGEKPLYGNVIQKMLPPERS